ncbi:hypothetical protein [Candidatus Absconditicoccus praedator]|uniref:hypothetical protein n=1 Tax=Candidatus Absconditicoccus praedator TaxID=2735562 RepID=UPI001E2C1005|nr:hypothetical protein [Candidatus Absconditicoccus praedator]UFX83120.1 hypothetical protein HLG78_03225 [Candidatus Absconditicoccus praedator]
MQNPEVGPRVEEIESGESQDQREDIEGQEKLEQANDFVVVNNLVEQIDQRHENMDDQIKVELQQNFKEVMEIDREKGETFLGWFAELDTQPEYINQFLNNFEEETGGRTIEGMFGVLNSENEGNIRSFVLKELNNMEQQEVEEEKEEVEEEKEEVEVEKEEVEEKQQEVKEENKELIETREKLQETHDKAKELQQEFPDEFENIEEEKQNALESMGEQRIAELENQGIDSDEVATVMATHYIIAGSSNPNLQRQAAEFNQSYEELSSKLGFLDNATASNLDKSINQSEGADEFVANNSLDINRQDFEKFDDTDQAIADTQFEINNTMLTKYGEYLSDKLSVFQDFENTADQMQVQNQEIHSDGSYSMEFQIGDANGELEVNSKGELFVTNFLSSQEGALQASKEKLEGINVLSLSDFTNQIDSNFVGEIATDSSNPDELLENARSATSEKFDSFIQENQDKFSQSMLNANVQKISSANGIISHYQPPSDAISYANGEKLTQESNPEMFRFADIMKNTLDRQTPDEAQQLRMNFDALAGFGEKDSLPDENMKSMLDAFQKPDDSSEYMGFVENFLVIKDGRESFDANKFSNFVDSVYRKEEFDFQKNNSEESIADARLEEMLKTV